MLVTAESLTGGLIGSTITRIPGVSRVYWGGVVTYNDEAKHILLGVDPGILSASGAVSRNVAEEMAIGVLSVSKADLAVAVTGFAGPAVGDCSLPVGTVWIALARKLDDGGSSVLAQTFRFTGSRNRIRIKTMRMAAQMLSAHLDRK